jgi:hypothetical protein
VTHTEDLVEKRKKARFKVVLFQRKQEFVGKSGMPQGTKVRLFSTKMLLFQEVDQKLKTQQARSCIYTFNDKGHYRKYR